MLFFNIPNFKVSFAEGCSRRKGLHKTILPIRPLKGTNICGLARHVQLGPLPLEDGLWLDSVMYVRFLTTESSDREYSLFLISTRFPRISAEVKWCDFGEYPFIAGGTVLLYLCVALRGSFWPNIYCETMVQVEAHHNCAVQGTNGDSKHKDASHDRSSGEACPNGDIVMVMDDVNTNTLLGRATVIKKVKGSSISAISLGIDGTLFERAVFCKIRWIQIIHYKHLSTSSRFKGCFLKMHVGNSVSMMLASTSERTCIWLPPPSPCVLLLGLHAETYSLGLSNLIGAFLRSVCPSKIEAFLLRN